MTYPFDTTTTDDLTDAQIHAASDAIQTMWVASEVRESPSSSHGTAIIALARLMRDHPELFEKPVDPAVLAVREAMAKRYEKIGHDRTAEEHRKGEWDKTPSFLAALDLLRTAKGGDA